MSIHAPFVKVGSVRGVKNGRTQYLERNCRGGVGMVSQLMCRSYYLKQRNQTLGRLQSLMFETDRRPTLSNNV